MKSKMQNRFLPLIVLLLTILVLVKDLPTIAMQDLDSLAFYRVIDDKVTYSKSSDKYERTSFSSPKGSYERYIERSPSLNLRIDNIASGVLEKQKIYTADKKGLQESAKEALGSTREKKSSKDDSPVGYVYKLTLALTSRESKTYADFAEKHNLESFAIKLGQHRLTIATILAPFEGSNLTVFLEEKNPDRLKQILSPIKNKVTWK